MSVGDKGDKRSYYEENEGGREKSKFNLLEILNKFVTLISVGKFGFLSRKDL